MTRSIAILTLALTAALSADQAFAGADNDCDGTTFAANIGQDDFEILNNSEAERELDALIAIIAFEYGPEAAYVTLRDMGFSDREAYDRIELLPDGKIMILGVLTDSEGGSTD